jgi:hypothetical protein
MERIVSMSDVCGRSRKATILMESIVHQNALNKTGYLLYNQYGAKDGVGFVPCSDKFVDNFLLQVLVPDYLVENVSIYFNIFVIIYIFIYKIEKLS